MHKLSPRSPLTVTPKSLSPYHSSLPYLHSSTRSPHPLTPTLQNTFSTTQQNSSQSSSPPALSDPHSPPSAPEPATYKLQSPNPRLLPPRAVRRAGVELRIRRVGPFLWFRGRRGHGQQRRGCRLPSGRWGLFCGFWRRRCHGGLRGCIECLSLREVWAFRCIGDPLLMEIFSI